MGVIGFAVQYSTGASEGQLRSWLQPHEHEPVLMFEHLYHRFERFKDGGVQAEFDARLRAGLRPAPELQVAITLLVEALRGRGGYNCLHVSAADLERNGPKVFSRAARLISPRRPTLLALLGLPWPAHQPANFAPAVHAVACRRAADHVCVIV